MAPPHARSPWGLPSIANPVPVGECRARGGGRASGPATRDRPPGGPPAGGARCILRRFGTVAGAGEAGARGPATRRPGSAAAIPARRVVRFVVSQTLKQAVAEVASPAD